MQTRLATYVMLSCVAMSACAKKDKDSNSDDKGSPEGDAGSDAGTDSGSITGTLAISATLPTDSLATTAILLNVTGVTVDSFADAQSTSITTGTIALTVGEPTMQLLQAEGDGNVANGIMIVTVPDGADKFESGAAMQFIEVPAAEGSELVKLPTELLGDSDEINLGDLTSNGESLSASTVKSSDFLQAESGLLAELASTDNGLKLVRNRYMNGDRGTDKYLEITPQYMFAGELAPFLTGNDFVPAQFVGSAKNTKYLGYLLRFGGKHPDLTVDNLCRAALGSPTAPKKELTLTPPQKDLTGTAQKPELVYNADSCETDVSTCPKGAILTSAKTAKKSGSTTDCGGDLDNDGVNYFSFSTINQDDGGSLLNFDWGSGAGYRGAIPAGLWDMKLDGKLIGRFDIGSAFPMNSDAADAYPLIYVPLMKVSRTATNAVQKIELKFAIWNAATSAYDEISDLKLFKGIVQGLTVRMEDHSTTSWSSQNGDGISIEVPMPASGNVLTATLPNGSKQWILGTDNYVDNDDEDTPHAHSFSISYDLYGVTYRFDMRP